MAAILRAFSNRLAVRQVPRGSVRINNLHSLSANLIGAWLPGLFAGRNIRVGTPNLTIGSNNGVGTPSYVNTADGPAWHSVNDTTGLSMLAPAGFKNTTGHSIYWRGSGTFNPSSGNVFIAGTEFGNPETNPFLIWAILNAGTGNVAVAWNNGAFQESGFAVVSNGFHSLAATFKVNGNVILYVDGVNKVQTTWGNATPPSVSATDRFNISSGWYSGVRSLTVNVNVVLIFNRELLPFEVRALDANPYAIFTPITRFEQATTGTKRKTGNAPMLGM